MIVASLALVAIAALGGFGLAWSIRDARQRKAERDGRRDFYPPGMSLELQDIEQRRAWRKLTPEEQAWVTDALFPAVAYASVGAR